MDLPIIIQCDYFLNLIRNKIITSIKTVKILLKVQLGKQCLQRVCVFYLVQLLVKIFEIFFQCLLFSKYKFTKINGNCIV